jgi:hypothetical protein
MNEEHYILAYGDVYSAESQPTPRRNMPPPSSGSENKSRKKAGGK